MRSQKRALFAAVLQLLCLTGCGGDESTLYSVLLDSHQVDAKLDSIFVEVHQGGSVWIFERDDFRVTAGNGTPHTREVRLNRRDSISILAGIRNGADTLARTSVELPSRPSYRWVIAVARDVRDPSGSCLSCWGKLATPIPVPSGTGEMLWVMWGGRQRGEPVY